MSRIKWTVLAVLICALTVQTGKAQENPFESRPVKLFQDSLTAPRIPYTILPDSLQKDSTLLAGNARKQVIEGTISYKAKDIVRMNQRTKTIYMYNEAEVKYLDTEIKAGVIVLNYETNEVYAGRIKDEDGKYSQLPEFKQGQDLIIPDSIRFNFDTERALIWNSRTEQAGALGGLGGAESMKILASLTKKENDSVYFMRSGRITTSKDTIDPDYYIKITKAKLVPGKKVIAGFSNMYLVDVPTPIALPFAYFPMSAGRTGGLIFPTFSEDPQRGFSIQNGGYYLPISDYVDFSVMGDFFTNGSYGIRLRTMYKQRYKFGGSIDFNFENLVNSQKGFDDFSRSTIYNLVISHRQDPKANPNSVFSASVNLGSSSFFSNSANQRNLALTQNNNLSSSISYRKTFPAYPSVNLNLTASHNQNTRTQQVQLTLPTLQASVERIFPFAKRDGVKKGLIQNVNMQYNVRAENRITTTDSLFLTPAMFEDARIGARHTIPISTNFKVAKYLSVTTGVNYEDIWSFETFTRGVAPDDPNNREIVLDTVKGFDRFNRYSFNANLGTTLYGTYQFKEGKKFQAIRHVMRPSVGWSFAPSFERLYDTYINNDGEEVLYTRFQGTLNGGPTRNKVNTMTFTLQNTLEAKVRDKDSTVTEPKKISLLSNLNFSTNYNFEADSLRLSPVNFNGATAFFDRKFTVNFSGSMDPYAINNNGQRINTLNIRKGGGLFRLTRFNLNLGFSLNNETFKREDKDEEDEDQGTGPGTGGPPGDDDYRAQRGGSPDDLFGFGINDQGGGGLGSRDDVENPAYGTKVPWDLRLAFNSSYNNSNRQKEFTNNSLMVSGNVELSPRWRVRVTTGYDFKNKGFNLTQLGFTRNLKSFDLRFNWVPFGRNERWDFFIGISSPILRDLKWESRSQRNISRF